MTATDRPRFATCLARLAAVFNHEVSTPVAAAYFDALVDVPIEAVEHAAGAYARAGKFFPKPVELRDLTAHGRLQPGELLEHLIGILRRSLAALPADLTDFDRFVVRALGGAEAFLTMPSWLLRKLVEERGQEWQDVAAVRGLEVPARLTGTLERPALPAPVRALLPAPVRRDPPRNDGDVLAALRSVRANVEQKAQEPTMTPEQVEARKAKLREQYEMLKRKA